MSGYDPIKDRAARSALISSGIVGLGTATLVKGFGMDLAVSLPLSVGAAISLDYIINVNRNKEAIRTLKSEANDFYQEQQAGKTTTNRTRSSF